VFSFPTPSLVPSQAPRVRRLLEKATAFLSDGGMIFIVLVLPPPPLALVTPFSTFSLFSEEIGAPRQMAKTCASFKVENVPLVQHPPPPGDHSPDGVLVVDS